MDGECISCDKKHEIDKSRYDELYSLSLAREHSLKELREFSEAEREAYQSELEELRKENLVIQEKDAEIQNLLKQLELLRAEANAATEAIQIVNNKNEKLQLENESLLQANRRMKIKAFQANIKQQQSCVAQKLADFTNSSLLTWQRMCPIDAHFATNEVLVMDGV